MVAHPHIHCAKGRNVLKSARARMRYAAAHALPEEILIGADNNIHNGGCECAIEQPLGNQE